MIQLRSEQNKAVKRIVAAWNSPWKFKHNTLLVGPTGVGKSVIGLSSFEEYMLQSQRKMRLMVIAHSKEIIHSLYRDANTKYHFGSVGMMADGVHQQWHQVTIGTVQSLAKPHVLGLVNYFDPIDVLIIDEAHRGVTPTHKRIWLALRKYNPDLRVLGMSATYDRYDERGLREVFTHCADRIQTKSLVKKKRLAKPVLYKELLYDDDPSEIAALWQQATFGLRKTLIFCNGVKHAKKTAKFFRQLGVDAVCVHGDTPGDKRRAAMNAHVITNDSVYTEGANIPDLGCVIVARKASKNPWKQMIGRGMRPDTDDCIIISMHQHYDPLERTPYFVLGDPKPIIRSLDPRHWIYQRISAAFG